ncbi:ClbS/DfsB family four-helix bundle protein [Lapidilactobacillus achengensis]|uniref:ClbS/DfsB family four-helix bundle protein n=1 Tax=Lapidilactobacillus achengensis TaxID=2486000 RepID=A0ABW1UN94_9LACO|nr:ClbS/DfsB family four-helix bundle protein [Lapidilactobacillus achengensis]
MARPTSKAELLTAATIQFSQLEKLIAQLPATAQTAEFTFPLTAKDQAAHWRRDRNLRDVLAHLLEWHQLLLNWVAANRGRVQAVPFLPAPYTWRNYAGLNDEFWRQHQVTSLTAAQTALRQSHQAVLALIDTFSDEALFTKAYFKWTGSTSLGSYCISATSSHYAWAAQKIKRQLRALKST